ncbi:ArsC/Spx/MgsR family protein [Saccharopolyspora mangrovi]|uniref:ArsC/Spx/MgsR family protein n=1 Tax=Saccharopolyspora mangrovi TaxID=3082379 RepID=A0ABU6AFB3_9PSEU|nr:ArsC/Spx/MgsR family protein [Saccharopolyspora sp. S2-29]MEB3370205.1 ArsC/Spx/MgsR family protein [Saccharopolyspora sp. S2-29]
MEIWVNPACSKCRSAVSELDAAGAEYVVRRYLEEPPSVAELEDVLGRLGLEPWDIARTGEAVAEEVGLRDLPEDAEHRAEWLRLMSENPKLIQRPIITASDSTTVVGRDPESVGRVIDAEKKA